jgi:hypothetical protein
VLEDAGELMSASARADVGQGLSRVLNLTDGLLGRGQRCLLLVTTNEPIGRLHPALRRPGRCWAEVEFAHFTSREASACLRRRGTARRATTAATLAELYALSEAYSQDKPERCSSRLPARRSSQSAGSALVGAVGGTVASGA